MPGTSQQHQQHQGECNLNERNHTNDEERNMLLSLFKDQDPPHHQGPGARPGTHGHHGHSQHWPETPGHNNSGYTNPIIQSNHFSTNPYLGGPNITPSYSNITGGLLEETKNNSQCTNDSSSGSESESSHSSSNHGKFDSHHSRSSGIRMNKDEKLAREAGIQLNIKQDIVDPPMDEFNDMLSKEDLTEEQLNICRDIRRRGKNKVAAQNCRKRKLEQIDELQKKVDEAKNRRNHLASEHKRLMDVYSNKVRNFTVLQDAILSHHEKSSHHYTVVVQGEDVRIMEKNAVPQDQRFPKSPDSLRYRPAPAPAPVHHQRPQHHQSPDIPDIAYTGSMMFSQSNQHPSYVNRAWD